MVIDNFISKPSTIRMSEIKNKFHSLLPSEHRTVILKNNNVEPFSNFCKNENVGEQINVNEYLAFNSNFYLGTISCMTNLLFNEKYGENISPFIYAKSTKKLTKGDFIISRNASLGKIAYLNREAKIILNGGISFFDFIDEYKFYVTAFFITSYGSNYLTCITSGGGTQQNAKRGTLLSIPIPKPTTKNYSSPQAIVNYVSSIVQNIIDKEGQIQVKSSQINNLIENELKSNQLKPFSNRFTTISSIKKNALRFDSGMYSEEYKILDYLIRNYSHGYFSIPVESFKSGSTPKVRIFGSGAKKKWVTPTDIRDEGFFTSTENISMPTNCNLKKDALLFINRTSKGKKGEFVGITCFYAHSYYGDGHHNQGIYRVENLEKQEMLFISAFMNAQIMRKICGYLSLGTKMKEMKMNNFSNLIFPKFSSNKKEKIARVYYNVISRNKELTLESYLDEEIKRNKAIGIFQLNQELIELKNKLSSVIDKILKEEPILIEL